MITFSYNYWESDALSESEVKEAFDPQLKGLGLDSAPQYIASASSDVLLDSIFPARKSVSKLFGGDFADTDVYYLLVWLKVYESNLNGEVAGYHKIADRLVHYIEVDGKFLLTDTQGTEIKQWLSDRGLSWSDGYPSVSECPGEEGQLIPEMHDPLLNDPDVLQ